MERLSIDPTSPRPRYEFTSFHAPRPSTHLVSQSDQSKGVKGLIDEQPAAKEVGRQVYRDSSSDDDYGYI